MLQVHIQPMPRELVGLLSCFGHLSHADVRIDAGRKKAAWPGNWKRLDQVQLSKIGCDEISLYM